MLSKTGLLFILTLSALFLLVKNFTVWTQDDQPISIREEQKTALQQGVKQFLPKTPKPLSSYEALVSRYLFLKERSEIIELEPEAVPEAAPETVPEPELATEPEAEVAVTEVKVQGTTIILHGIIFLDDFKSALINNPSKKEEERENKWVKVGNRLGNMEVDRIERDRIILRDGKQKFIILLHDDSKPKGPRQTREAQKKTKPTVISTVASRTPADTAKKTTSPAAEEITDDGYITVKTPFGTVRKKIR